MSDIIDPEGFRANVGTVLLRNDGHVFLGRRTGGRGWQFPQGGMREGESLEQSLYRELHEETGLTAADVKLLGCTASWERYRLPPRYVRRNRRPVCIGQKQRWFLLAVQREDIRFELGTTAEPEFDEWRWVGYWEPIREVIFFKRPVYIQALRELAPLAAVFGAAPEPAWVAELAAAQGGTGTSADSASSPASIG
jgi:putative (di)nucleoside polyphosphate hydrolase